MKSKAHPEAGFPATFEAQSASLRRLARSLVGESAADDVVQETWTAYLTRPPAEAGALGGFLATLTRRLAWKARRGEERRSERERMAARMESSPEPDEFTERASVLREALDALSSLREPYRRALWQRYFDDLPPREIARASGESLATIKSRLQRGLELLREELDRRHGGRRSNWAVWLTPLSAAGAGALGIGISGGLLLGHAIKLTAAAILIAGLGGWYLWSSHQAAGAPLAVVPPAKPALADARQGSVDVQPMPTPERSAVAGAEAPAEPALVVESELAHPYLYMLVVRALDEYGLPVDHAALKLGPARSSLNAASALCEVNGSTTLIWRGKEAEMDVDVQVGDSPTMQGSRRVHLRAGTPSEVALVAPSSVHARPVLRLDFIAVTGNVLTTEMALSDSSWGRESLTMSRFAHPHARFGDSFVSRQVVRPPDMEERFSEAVGQQLYVEAEGVVRSARVMRGQFKLAANLDMTKLAMEPDTSKVTVHVLDDRGEPAVQALVTLGSSVDSSERAVFTDEHGDVLIDSVPSGWFEARAGGGPAGLARERLFVEAPNPLEWTAHLDRGARIVGKVLDAEGKPAADKLIRYESTPDVVARSTSVSMTLETRGGEEISEHGETRAGVPGELRTPWVDQTVLREDGSFEFANLPLGLGRLLVLDQEDADGRAWIVEEGVLPGEQEHVLRIEAQRGSLQLEVKLDPAIDEPKLEVRLISETTGRGVAFHRKDEGSFEVSDVASGWYRVEVGAGCYGWHDLGRHYVAQAGRVDLGSFAPPPPATLRVIQPESFDAEHPLELTFYLRRGDIDVRGEPRSLNGSDVLLLPSGEYWAFWTTRDGAIHHKALKLEAGGASVLDLR
ncbi:MAG TPA: sigma-70 family RNA polymerase sigma factor [Planctomycetota bacterium]|nr:sigma-70 family RNA polymerase sigma factor [Planctomycetota bacterium]